MKNKAYTENAKRLQGCRPEAVLGQPAIIQSVNVAMDQEGQLNES